MFSKKSLYFVCLSLLLMIKLPSTGFSADSENDPFEKTNRAIFDFNNSLDDNVFKPIAKGWRKVPEFPRKPLSNLATTAKTPISLANAILQLNRESIGNILGKFLINMTFGLGGMFDIAGTQEFGSIPTVEEDFGQTLATWGVPDGPYIMLPVFGPSSVRDSFGLGVDTITNPLSFAYRMNSIGLEARLSGPVVRGVATREKYLDYVDEMKAGSLDWYATMRSLYRQKRKKEISGVLEDEKVALNVLSTDVYSDPEPESNLIDSSNQEIVAETNKEITQIVESETKKRLMPSDMYGGFETTNLELDSNKGQEIAKIVSDESKKIMPAPRIYNGVLPSSSYPGFSKSRVNLIN